MKKILILLLISVSVFASDPWQPYDHGKGKGKDRPHPVVPESAVYGAAFISVCMLVYLVRGGVLKSLR